MITQQTLRKRGWPEELIPQYINSNISTIKHIEKSKGITPSLYYLQRIKQIDSDFIKMPLNLLIKLVVDEYNKFKFDSGSPFDCILIENCNTSFLYRITVNYIRHSICAYKSLLPSICKLKEKEIVYLALNKKVYEDIVTYYPELREECERQLLKKECVFNSDNRREK